jgi:hypothetical protein
VTVQTVECLLLLLREIVELVIEIKGVSIEELSFDKDGCVGVEIAKGKHAVSRDWRFLDLEKLVVEVV